jgi:hypothetical protein
MGYVFKLASERRGDILGLGKGWLRKEHFHGIFVRKCRNSTISGAVDPSTTTDAYILLLDIRYIDSTRCERAVLLLTSSAVIES